MISGESGYGYEVPDSSVSVPLENITYNYSEDDACLEFKHENGGIIRICLHPSRITRCVFFSEKRPPLTSKAFLSAFPVDFVIVPTLSPFEAKEPFVYPETVRANEQTRLASRNFRNIWRLKSDEEFRALNAIVSSSWDGITLSKPETYFDGKKNIVEMFYNELQEQLGKDSEAVRRRNSREISWSGFGFQIWLQLNTHLMRSTTKSVIVIDEPDIYLHSDLQRTLLRIVREKNCQYVMATHAVEIINDAEPREIVAINPKNRTARRVATDDDLQSLFNHLGSVENVDIARLSKVQRIIFFEGNDKKILKKFARKLGAAKFTETPDALVFQVGGFGGWKRVEEVAWTFRNILKLDIGVYVLFDRDYRCNEEIERFSANLSVRDILCDVLDRKEIENYALAPEALVRTIHKRLRGEARLPKCKRRCFIGGNSRYLQSGI